VNPLGKNTRLKQAFKKPPRAPRAGPPCFRGAAGFASGVDRAKPASSGLAQDGQGPKRRPWPFFRRVRAPGRAREKPARPAPHSRAVFCEAGARSWRPGARGQKAPKGRMGGG
jgi:hypothetical protein